jgi:hypothetical protein
MHSDHLVFNFGEGYLHGSIGMIEPTPKVGKSIGYSFRHPNASHSRETSQQNEQFGFRWFDPVNHRPDISPGL